jgi:hypothetical protein
MAQESAQAAADTAGRAYEGTRDTAKAAGGQDSVFLQILKHFNFPSPFFFFRFFY